MINEHIKQIDFEDAGYQTEVAEEYAREVAETIGEKYGFDKVSGSEATYIKTRGRIIPSHELAVDNDGSKVKYNEELVTDGNVLDAVNEGLGPSRISNDEIANLLED